RLRPYASLCADARWARDVPRRERLRPARHRHDGPARGAGVRAYDLSLRGLPPFFEKSRRAEPRRADRVALRGGVAVVGDRDCDRLTMEREKGFEPSTSTLARLHSTTELLPQWQEEVLAAGRLAVKRRRTSGQRELRRQRIEAG